jgi:hypothetical protein
MFASIEIQCDSGAAASRQNPEDGRGAMTARFPRANFQQ